VLQIELATRFMSGLVQIIYHCPNHNCATVCVTGVGGVRYACSAHSVLSAFTALHLGADQLPRLQRRPRLALQLAVPVRLHAAHVERLVDGTVDR